MFHLFSAVNNKESSIDCESFEAEEFCSGLKGLVRNSKNDISTKKQIHKRRKKMIEDQENLEGEEEEKKAPAVDMGITLISCADCERPLLNMLKVRDSDEVSKVKVICVNKHCTPDKQRGESWVHTLTGQYFHSTIKERDIVKSMTEEDGVMTIKMGKTRGGRR